VAHFLPPILLMAELVTRIADAVVKPSSGPKYDVYVRAAAREDGLWEGRLEFTPHDGTETLSTGVETTQPSSEAITYWATGLGVAFLEGAFVRAAEQRNGRQEAPAVAAPLPTPAGGRERLEHIRAVERHVLSFFERRGTTFVETATVFGEPGLYANADLVRAFEDLEKNERLLVRHTEGGRDWLELTTEGARALGIRSSDTATTAAEPPRARQ
jgi:hypothetical protein